MERDFRSFKEQMQTDVRQATDYKETIQQLQSRGRSKSLYVIFISSTKHSVLANIADTTINSYRAGRHPRSP
jgi:uncharacterized protein (DUF302 family)